MPLQWASPGRKRFRPRLRWGARVRVTPCPAGRSKRYHVESVPHTSVLKGASKNGRYRPWGVKCRYPHQCYRTAPWHGSGLCPIEVHCNPEWNLHRYLRYTDWFLGSTRQRHIARHRQNPRLNRPLRLIIHMCQQHFPSHSSGIPRPERNTDLHDKPGETNCRYLPPGYWKSMGLFAGRWHYKRQNQARLFQDGWIKNLDQGVPLNRKTIDMIAIRRYSKIVRR